MSPVTESLSPTIAPISPTLKEPTSSLSSACIRISLLALSLISFDEFRTYDPESILPEYILKYERLPTCGSLTILNTNAENGSDSSAFLSISLFVLGSTPTTGGTSKGDGRQIVI